jgi:acetolactate synthase regulatory subunit
MEELIITNYDQMVPYFKHLTEDVNWFDDKEIKFGESLGGIKIHMEGKPFDSSITSGMMRAILSLQDAVYDSYSLYCYGTIKRLSDEERRMLELRIRIEQGSSIFEIFIEEVAKAAGDRIRAMTAKQVIGTIATVAIIAAVSINVSKEIDSKREIARLTAQNKLVTDVQKITNEAALSVLESQSTFYRSLSKQDYNTLDVNDKPVSKVEVSEITKVTREKRPIEQQIYKDQFVITDIHFSDDTIYLDVTSPSTGKTIKYVNIFKDIVSEDDYQWFKDSTNRQPIDMTIVATEKKGEIIGAFLQSFKK